MNLAENVRVAEAMTPVVRIDQFPNPWDNVFMIAVAHARYAIICWRVPPHP